jgi:outer membrane lipoprotein-sorting protein
MKKYRLFILTVFLFHGWLAVSQEKAAPMKNPQIFKQKLAEATRNTSSIESSFTQEKCMSVLSEKIQSKGKFYFRKKNMLRWEYTYPYSYILILNNGKILVKDEEKESHYDAASNKVFAEINTILLGCTQGTILNDDKKFRSSYYETAGNYFVKLLPKNKQLSDIISEIQIYFDKHDLSVTRLVMNEQSGDYTAIDFFAKRMNAIIPDEKFSVQ